MVPFLTILVAFIVQCTVSLMAFRPSEDFISSWQAAYRLAFGDFEDAEENSRHGDRLYFIIITIIIPLVLLNLLIAIMSEVFDDVQSTRAKEDIVERLSLILEISKFFKFRHRNNSEKKYIHVCTNDKIEQ